MLLEKAYFDSGYDITADATGPVYLGFLQSAIRTVCQE